MARIETYPLDGNISVNDYVIGTDGDSFNATKNYKVLTFLDYLGRLYNLNSTDLLFNFVDMPSTMISAGEVSTNNYADGTLLMSGVTNIYVSKVTAFGQLVDDILTSIGDEGLTIMFADMGNRNNLGIFTVVSAVDVDANTINLTVTATTALGSIDAGKVMGIRIGVGGGGVVPTLSQVLTQDNDAASTGITNLGFTTMSGAINSQAIYPDADNARSLGTNANRWVSVYSKQFIFNPQTSDLLFNSSNLGQTFYRSDLGRITYWDGSAYNRIATLDDIPAAPNLSNYVTLNTVQTISGVKTFSDRTSVSSFNMLPNGGGVLSGRHTLYVNTSNQLAWLGLSSTKGVLLDQSLITSGNPIVKFQATGGTIAHLSDIPSAPATVAFTPDIIDTTGGATYSHSTATGEYVRTGDLVTFSIAITNIATTGTGTGELRITGLPLSPTRTSSALVELSGFIGVNFYQLQARVTTAGNIDFRYQAALDDSMSTLPADTIDAGTAIYISGSIIV
tara:strand:+ start:1397 stop:2914 length:1518 start_codon:yes stop_codon:yes gene_type:complete